MEPLPADALSNAIHPDDSADASGTTVLVIDDEPPIREVIRRILERAGLLVVEAGDGEEGLRLVQDGPARFDLVLTNIEMPRVGGRAVWEVLLRHRPELPVLGMSGRGQAVTPSVAGAPTMRVLPKPCDGEVLIEVVHTTVRHARTLRARAALARAEARRSGQEAVDLVAQARALGTSRGR